MDNQIEVAEQETADETICKKCHSARIDNSESEFSVLCEKCRGEHIKYPFPKWVIVFFIVILAACYSSITQFSNIASEYHIFSEADKAYAEKHYYTANKLYKEIYEEKGEKTRGIGEKLFQTAMKIQNYEQAVEMFNKYYYDKKVSDKEYKLINSMVTMLTYAVEDQNELVELGIKDTTSAGEIIEIINKLGENEMSPYIKYIKANTLISEYEFAEALSLLEAIESDERGGYLNVYPLMASCCRRMNDFENAKAYAQKALNNNKDDYEAIRQLAVIEVLSNNYPKAIEYAQEAFSICPDGTYIADILAVAYYLNNNNEELDYIIEYAKTNGILIDSYDEISQGIKTVDEIYRD